MRLRLTCSDSSSYSNSELCARDSRRREGKLLTLLVVRCARERAGCRASELALVRSGISERRYVVASVTSTGSREAISTAFVPDPSARGNAPRAARCKAACIDAGLGGACPAACLHRCCRPLRRCRLLLFREGGSRVRSSHSSSRRPFQGALHARTTVEPLLRLTAPMKRRLLKTPLETRLPEISPATASSQADKRCVRGRLCANQGERSPRQRAIMRRRCSAQP